MNRLFLLFCFLSIMNFTPIDGFAQQKETSFGAFYASPIGKFKSTDLEEGGFAKPGWGLVFDSKNQLSFLGDSWFVYFHSTYQFNKMDNEALSAAYSDFLGYNTVVSASKYSPILVTIGPAYDFKLNENITIGLYSGLGIMFNNTKAFTIKVYDNNDNEIVNELVNFDNHAAFAYLFGIDLQFSLIPDLLSVELYTDYTSANQKVEFSFASGDSLDSFQK